MNDEDILYDVHSSNEIISEHSEPQYIEYRPINSTLKICQINVEGLTKEKCEYLSRLMYKNKIDVLLLQETHQIDETHMKNCGPITGFNLVDSLYHRNYGIATLVKNDIKNVAVSSKLNLHGTALLTVVVNSVSILNIYKPPSAEWSDIMPILPVLPHPAVYMGDFNSHHTLWGYNNDDTNGEFIVNWALNNDLHLMFDAKDTATFFSRRWNSNHNPDLCFVSTDTENMAMPADRTVLRGFPKSQHRPVILEIGIQIPIVNSRQIPRWNFQKANWISYGKMVDSNIRWFDPNPNNYDRFVGVMIAAAKRCIPRGFRRQYIPKWTHECEVLWNEYKITGSVNTGAILLQKLNLARKEKWMQMVQNMNFQGSSRTAWNLLRKLGTAKYNNQEFVCPIQPKQISKRLLKMSKVPMNKELKRSVENKYARLKKKFRYSVSEIPDIIDVEELNIVLNSLKNGKACGTDGLFPEFFKYLNRKARLWLAKFLSCCYRNGHIVPEWNKSEITAILKPGKSKDLPESYRPISLLCVTYKIFERIIYNRVAPIINEVVPPEQAGFRPNRNCCDQVMALTTHIEAGFQAKKKTSVVFVDLSAAYDTVWKKGLLLKLLRTIKCLKTVNIIDKLLSNRKFRIHLGGKSSMFTDITNGLPQGSVLAPLLFNLYTSDIPTLASRKFVYADDLAIAFQYEYNEMSESNAINNINDDLHLLNEYYRNWRLRANPTKTEVTTFHLANRNANDTIQVNFAGNVVPYNFNPKYLGITLDRSLTYRKHLEKTRAKLKSRNNIIQKLCGSSWGTDANTLRISSLALVYSVAEYCSPVWRHSHHVRMVDTQLNSTMRLITGAIKSTPLPWLHILSNIAPPCLRREAALVREYNKIKENTTLEIHTDLANRGDENRLLSRNPLWTQVQQIDNLSTHTIEDRWLNYWNNSEVMNSDLVECPNVMLNGFDQPRRRWVTLNRLRTGHAKSNEMLFRWNLIPSPACDCGAPIQTMTHIVEECPRRKFNYGGLKELNELSQNAIDWLDNLDISL